jgi:ectoine hydroxylase-related dioxygenase (phytanoyl-CoA dioxygenase family)
MKPSVFTTPVSWQSGLERDGYAVLPEVADPNTVASLLHALAGISDIPSVRRRESIYGIRNLLDVVPEVSHFAESPAVRSVIETVLGPDSFPVRGILFDKTPDANWIVTWHQDLTIAVRERRDVPGFGPWSKKAGIAHVQPPAAVLDGMLTLRLHLDPCDLDNGPLRVCPGSHRFGRLDNAAIQTLRRERQEVVCPVPAGGALLMRPLLLHASSEAKRPGHRRVVHLDFAASALPDGLQWQSRPVG